MESQLSIVEQIHNLLLTSPWIAWTAFAVLIVVLLVLDLGVFHKHAHRMSVKEASLMSLLWISVGCLFGVGVWVFFGPEKGSEYFTGFIIEKSLSVDNIFVFIMIFSFFHIKQQYQHKILFYGIVCAIVMRAIAIFAGAALLQEFHWLMYVFGAFLIFTAAKMIFLAGKEPNPESNAILKFVTKRFPMEPNYDTEKFWIRKNGKLLFTPLFLALMAIEFSDVIFAIDSVPAVLAVTNDPFIVYTSNVFAILGLRALYFISAELMTSLRYLGHGVALVLFFVGTKMMISGHYKIPSNVSLMVIGGLMGAAVVASLVKKEKKEIGNA